MEQIQTVSQPRRGRPPSGRKVVLQVPVEPEEAQIIKDFAAREGKPIAEVVRDILHGAIKWRDVVK